MSEVFFALDVMLHERNTLQKLGVFKQHHFDIILILNQYQINIEMISLFFNIKLILLQY